MTGWAPQRAPAIVLLHGYTASMRWWRPVSRVLAEGFHVVRTDLLGHGQSEKPGDGYAITQQADLVASPPESSLQSQIGDQPKAAASAAADS
jgi:pimeloyl-ACP methyl ester carboxylesterase